MKKLVALLMMAAVVAATPALAKQGDKSADLSIHIAGEPDEASGIGSGVGFSIGGGYEIIDQLQIRGDIGYNSWSDTGVDLSSVPVEVSARYIVPVVDKVKAYGQFGLAYFFNSADVSGVGSDDDNKFGFTLGAGAEYEVAPQFGIGLGLKYNSMSDWAFIQYGLTGSYHF